MEIVKTNQSTTNNSSSNVKKDVAGNIYWKYDKTTKTGKLLLKKGNETYEVNNLNVTLNAMYLFVNKDKISMSSLCGENETNELYFVSLPSFYFIEFYNNNPITMKLINDNGKLRIDYLEIVDKKEKITDDDKKYFNLLNFLANADNSDLAFTIKIFIR